MSLETTAHLNFGGQARDALDFYLSVFGGEQKIVTYGDVGATQDEIQRDRVMWGQVFSPQGFRVMAYDVQPSRPWKPGENAFYICVRGTSAEEIEGYWDKLSDGASVQQNLGASAWSALYGMLTDRFGVTWILDVMAV